MTPTVEGGPTKWKPANLAVKRTAGSHSLAAATYRSVMRTETNSHWDSGVWT